MGGELGTRTINRRSDLWPSINRPWVGSWGNGPGSQGHSGCLFEGGVGGRGGGHARWGVRRLMETYGVHDGDDLGQAVAGWGELEAVPGPGALNGGAEIYQGDAHLL